MTSGSRGRGHRRRWEVAARLDELFSEMLASEVEVATRHFDGNLTDA
jgi:hypothetical protein